MNTDIIHRLSPELACLPPLERATRLMGGTRNLADLLGITPSGVYEAKRKRSLARQHHMRIEEVTHFQVDARELLWWGEGVDDTYTALVRYYEARARGEYYSPLNGSSEA